ncbi:MAG: nicotinamidase-related amidase [Limisphaerales bacterium]
MQCSLVEEGIFQADEVIIGGMQSNYCVQETCKGAIEHGYHVLIPNDAHSTLDEGDKKAIEFIKAQNLAWASQSGNIKVRATNKIIN